MLRSLDLALISDWRLLLADVAVAVILLASALGVTAESNPHAPIAVRFHLDRSGYVTLVIEDEHGMRVRNLVSETYFRAGDNVVWWDGLDDLGRDPDSAAHGIYYIPGKLVAPGTYRVRGLYRQAIQLRYEFSVYNPGQPPWLTSASSSGWLTNHTPPETICFIPAGAVPVDGHLDSGAPAQVLIGSYVAEGGSGLAWLDLDGHKLRGQMWVGGDWTGAEQIARDLGPHAQSGVYAYVASSWQGELRLRELVNDPQRRLAPPSNPRLGTGEDVPVLHPSWRFPRQQLDGIGGLAAYNGLLVLSLPKMDCLLFVDAERSRVIGTLPLNKPGGLYADSQGKLYSISENKVLRAELPRAAKQMPDVHDLREFIAEGLDQPQQMAMDAAQNLYVSNWGSSNQVKVFSPSGIQVRSIGIGGVIESGPYNPEHMHRPTGITIDSRNHLWVAEQDFQPKRVSLWKVDGQFLRAFYGPAAYGGGGNLDPRDKSLFYFDGMTFGLNWSTGESKLLDIQHHFQAHEEQLVPKASEARSEAFQEPGGEYKSAGASENPDLPIYFHGHKYWTNAYNSNPMTGTSLVGIWISQHGVARPVAAFGRADSRQLFLTAALRLHIPGRLNWHLDRQGLLDLSAYTFAWSDLNDDGIPEAEEVKLVPGIIDSATVSSTLELVTNTGVSYRPSWFTLEGAPVYDLNAKLSRGLETQKPISTGGGQVLTTGDDWTILTTAPKPFASESLAGVKPGVGRWSYPSLWPGLHASHISPAPEFPGELIGTTRLLGPSFRLKEAKDVELWAINGNKGSIYLFTSDGLFVATLFADMRAQGSSWTEQTNAKRGMLVSHLSAGEENFWPSIVQTEDGEVCLVSNFPGIFRVDGVDSIRRLFPPSVRVTAQSIARSRAFFADAEAFRKHSARKPEALIVPVSAAALRADSSPWDPKQFVTLDVRANQVGDWGSSSLRTEAALRVAGDRLYALFRTGDPHAVDSAASSVGKLFSTARGLDLMLGTDPKSDPERKSAVLGDIRLIVSVVEGKPKAVLYRPRASSGRRNVVIFPSPLGALKFDDVEDVSQYLQLKIGSGGDFEFCIPLRVLGLDPVPGSVLRGDLGLLRGDGAHLVQRAYWSNKAAGLVADLPSEGDLQPQLWGTVKFVSDSRPSPRQ